MRRSNSQKRAVVSSVVGLVGGDTVSIRKLPVDFCVKIGEGLTYVRIELPHSCLVRSHSSSWLRGVVHKIICEEFFEDFESPFALNFLSATTDNRFRFIRSGSLIHENSFRVKLADC